MAKLGIGKILKRVPWRKVAAGAARVAGIPVGGLLTGANEEIVDQVSEVALDPALLESALILVQTIAGAFLEFLIQRRRRKKERAERLGA